MLRSVLTNALLEILSCRGIRREFNNLIGILGYPILGRRFSRCMSCMRISRCARLLSRRSEHLSVLLSAKCDFVFNLTMALTSNHCKEV